MPCARRHDRLAEALDAPTPVAVAKGSCAGA
ncbi:hypothetical protein FHS40_000576 [Streptomyces spectabilis]|uniref:Uncharacterized protein n=1 Tax=Streptomyces spectabilis TaxID=68270 RepID=A0A7W8ANA3_STRST|nr:hypothetical protein [Streptomyces spectabilis]